MVDFFRHRHGRPDRQRSLRLWLAVFAMAYFIGRCSIIAFSNWSVGSPKAAVDYDTDQGAVARRTLLPGMVSTAVLIATPGESDAAMLPSGGSKVYIADLLKVYNRLAGPYCFGQQAPEGFSCQATLDDFDRVVFKGAQSVTVDEFIAGVNAAPSRWPLNPAGDAKYTVDKDNPAERQTLRQQAQRFGLEDLTIKQMALAVSERLSQEPVEVETAKFIFKRFQLNSKSPSGSDSLSRDDFIGWLGNTKKNKRQALDVDSFQKMIGLFEIIYPQNPIVVPIVGPSKAEIKPKPIEIDIRS